MSKRTRTEQEVLDDRIVELLHTGNYIDSARISRDLCSYINISKLTTFRDLERINRFIDAGIDVFVRTKSILLYHELEDYLVRSYCEWKKSIKIESFSNIGVGQLSHHPVVSRVFGFWLGFDSSTLPRIQYQDVLKSIFDYYDKNSRLFQKRFSDSEWESANESCFHYVCEALQVSEPPGFVIDLKDIVPAFQRIQYEEEREIQKLSNKLTVKALSEITDNVNRSLQSLSKKTTLTTDKRSDGVLTVHAIFRSAKLDAQRDFERLYEVILLASSLSYESIQQQLCNYCKVATIEEDRKRIIFSTNPSKKIAILTTGMSYFLVLLVLNKLSIGTMDDERASLFDDEPSMDEKGNPSLIKDDIDCRIRSLLASSVARGFPAEVLMHLQSEVTKLMEMNAIGFSVEETISPNHLVDAVHARYLSSIQALKESSGSVDDEHSQTIADLQVTFISR
jgi:hypothetical protein